MMRTLHKKFRPLTLGAYFVTFASCSTPYTLERDYNNQLSRPRTFSTTGQTTLVILIDGLGKDTASRSFQTGNLEATRKFFENNGQTTLLHARAAFPSLTISSVSSLLTGMKSGTHGIVGNRIFYGDKVVNFESPSQVQLLNHLLDGKTIFSRLTKQGLKSVSLDSHIATGTTAHIEPDAKLGLRYATGMYKKIDRDNIQSLNKLLQATSTQNWPELAFIHLVGVDSIAHKKTDQSKDVTKYIAWLDRELAPLYQTILQAEKSSRKITTLLTADHGHTAISSYSNIEKYLSKLDSDILVANEARFMSLRYPKSWLQQAKERETALLALQTGVQSTALKTNDDIIVYFKPELSGFVPGTIQRFIFKKKTNSSADSQNDQLALTQLKSFGFSEHYLNDLRSYFESPYSAEALILAGEGVSFLNELASSHGGMTEKESIIPVLLRNAQLNTNGKTPTLSELLSFVENQPTLYASNNQAETLSSIEEEAVDSIDSNALEQTGPNFELEFSSGAHDSYNSRTKLRHPYLPDFDIDFEQRWSAQWGSGLFTSFSFNKNINDQLVLSSSFKAGPTYEFRNDQKFLILAGLKADQNGNIIWIPTLGLGFEAKLITLSWFDLGVQSSIDILFPKHARSRSTRLGFQESLNLELEHALVDTDNTVGLRAGFEHQSNSDFSKLISFFYRFGF